MFLLLLVFLPIHAATGFLLPIPLLLAGMHAGSDCPTVAYRLLLVVHANTNFDFDVSR